MTTTSRSPRETPSANALNNNGASQQRERERESFGINNNASDNSTSEEEILLQHKTKKSPTSPTGGSVTTITTPRRQNKSMFRDISRRQWDPRYHKQCTQTQCMKHPSIIKGMRLLKNLPTIQKRKKSSSCVGEEVISFSFAHKSFFQKARARQKW